MMKTRPLTTCALLCAALCVSTLAPDVLAQSAASAAPPAGAASAAATQEVAPTVRPELGNLLIDAQRLLGEKNSKDAAEKLRAADAVANQTPYEQHILARVKGALAQVTGDAEMAEAQYQLASQGPWLKPTDRVAGMYAIAGLYYNAKNYAKAIDWITRYQQQGGNDPALTVLLGQSYYLNADYANAAKALEAEVGKALAQGKVPVEIQLKLLADSRSRMRDDAGYSKALETLVQYYPSKATWRSLMARLWSKPQLAGRLQLDVFRLQMASAGLTDAVDYTEMAALAMQEGSAIEAARVLDLGYAAGLLVSGDKGGELQRLTDKVRKSAAEDRATLDKDVLRAKTLSDGLAMFNYGFNLFQSGQTERGVIQMEQGLAKGIARNADLARLRLVAVYADLKQRDKALPLLQALSGKTDPVGLEECVRYWTLLLR
ncbi:MAG: hypothetical protein WCK94_10165 [Comamonadaceae bacterium]|jgi:hypothetical protein